MVSKLSFKGDKNKKNKRKLDKSENKEQSDTLNKKQKSIRDEDIILINNKLTDINTTDPSTLESGWSTANVVGDLNGPAIIIPIQESEQEQADPRVMCVGKEEEIGLSTDLEIDDEPINFNSYDDESVYQKLQPRSGNQVFTLNNVLSLVGSKEEIRDSKLNKSESIKLSLKSKNDFNLTTFKDDLKCDSKVLTSSEIFQFTKVKDGEMIRWQISTLDGRKLYLLQNGKFKLIRDEENLLNQLFVVRVHIKNTVVAKKIKLLKSES